MPAPLAGSLHYAVRSCAPPNALADAIQSSMRQALIGVRHGVLLQWALIKPPEEHYTPGTLKAAQVALVEPVAYLKD